MAPSRGLTLIEMLVAIGIVVVLLAILAVALTGTINDSELAVCSTRLKAIAAGVTSYAAGQHRSYPVPPSGSRSWVPSFVGRQSESDHDLRPLFKDFLSLDVLVCPKVEPISLAPDQAGDSKAYSTYELWAGWQFRTLEGTYPGMLRLGDNWEWKGRTFRILAGDADFVIEPDPSATPLRVEGCHPDSADLLMPLRYQDANDEPVGFTITWSGWYGRNGRGIVDENMAFDDGSVQRYGRLGLRDSRLIAVPWTFDGSRPENRLYVPVR
jgi:prepilin-type N-terminal cleavage/methylation domain-containing protein